MKYSIIAIALFATLVYAEDFPWTGCEEVKCPSQNGPIAIHKPNPFRCDSFCECDWGNAVYFECPDGLHFNKELEVCDWPESAKCKDSGAVSPTPGDEPVKLCENVVCPPTNEGNATHLPNPGDCASFCKCDWGNPVWFACPDGLHFNPILQVCDWPRNVNCDGGGGGEDEQSTTVNPPGPTSPRPTTPKPTIAPTGPTSAPNNGCEKVVCPPTNEGNATHYPNPEDCGSFCKCDWGTPVWFACPDGLHFDPILQVCDWPENVGCGGEDPPPGNDLCEFAPCPPAGECGATNVPADGCDGFCKCENGIGIWKPCPPGTFFNPDTEICDFDEHCAVEPPPTTTLEPSTGGCSKVNCPAQNGEFALHLPNPDDCASFCKCDWGVGIYFDCPDGLHFNPLLEVCDWPLAAGCGVDYPADPIPLKH